MIATPLICPILIAMIRMDFKIVAATESGVAQIVALSLEYQVIGTVKYKYSYELWNSLMVLAVIYYFMNEIVDTK